jgi:hypothetical protein
VAHEVAHGDGFPDIGEAADEPNLELLEATVSNRKPNKNNKKHQKTL